MEEETKQSNEKNPQVLRTYTSDMAEVIRNNEISVIKIALAEKERKEREQDAMSPYKTMGVKNNSKIFFIVGGIILIVAAVLVSYFLIQKKNTSVLPVVTTSNVETFLSYDSSSNLDVTNVTNVNELEEMIKKEKQSNPKLINALFFSKKITDIPEMVISSEFLSLIGSTAPLALIRSLSDKYLFGEYSNEKIMSKNNPAMFLVLETKDYNQAYASMLTWEKTLLKDFYVLFNIDTSNSSGSLFEKPWKDTIINNKDARVLYGDKGEEILYYIFVNNNDFIITNNINALKEVMERMLIKNTKAM